MRNSNSLPPRSDNGHSTKEVEHRFTELEVQHQISRDDRDELFSIAAKHTDKLTLHERVLLGLLMALATLLQDKFPALALALKTLIGS